MDNQLKEAFLTNCIIVPGKGESTGPVRVGWSANVGRVRDNYYFNKMHQIPMRIIAILILLASCQGRQSEELRSFEVFCEMVASDAKPIALHHPLEPETADALWEDFLQLAEKYKVELYREDAFPDTMLFPRSVGSGKSVVLIYRDSRLQQYLQWKKDLMESKDTDARTAESLARRLGRLLGYSPRGINGLLRKHSAYRDLASFTVTRQVTHLYYKDPAEAGAFYKTVLGLEPIGDGRFRIGEDVFIHVHPFDEDHGEDQPRSTAIALLTDQLPEWYAHIQQAGVPVKYTYKPREGGPHDGFVAMDPGGYLLEFEQFKQHPENELFMAVLASAPRMETSVDTLNFYGSITWTYHNDLLKMQRFYEEDLGFRMVADQGWTKIYQTSSTGFIGLVDERRGMEDYAEDKAVEIEWGLMDSDGFQTHANTHWGHHKFSAHILTGPERYRYRLRGAVD